MSVKRTCSNLLITTREKLGIAPENFKELSPSTYKNFNQRYRTKFYDNPKKDYLKKDLNFFNVTYKEESFLEAGAPLLLEILPKDEVVCGGLSLSFLFESTVEVMIQILKYNYDHHTDGPNSMNDEFRLHSKTLGWTLISHTAYNPIEDDSVCFIGSDSFIEQASSVCSQYDENKFETYKDPIMQFPSI